MIIEGEAKGFHDKRRSEEFMGTRPLLHWLLERMIQTANIVNIFKRLHGGK